MGVRVNGEPRYALQFCYDDSAGYPGQGDLACGVRIVDALAGQGAAPVIHIAAIRVFDLELDALQGDGLGPVPAPLFDHQITQGLIPKFQSDGLARLDLDGLGDIIQQVSRFGSGFLHHQRGAGGDIFHQEGAGGIRHELAIGVAHHGSVRGGHEELHPRKRELLIIIRHLLDQDGPLGTVAEIYLNNLLILAGEVYCLRWGIDDVRAVTG